METSKRFGADMYIYKIVNVENGKHYIGQTRKSATARFFQHMHKLKKGKHGNRHLQFSYNKSATKEFRLEILDKVAFDFGLDNLEKFWIKKLDSIENGYNLIEGGNGARGLIHSQSAKKRIGEASRLRGGGKIGAAKLIGRKMDASSVLKTQSKNTGKKRSKEFCKKISKIKIGNKNRCTKVVDDLGNVYNSIKEAAVLNNCKPDSITEVLGGKRKTIYKRTFSYLKKVGG